MSYARKLLLRLALLGCLLALLALPLAFQRLAVEGPDWIQAGWVGEGGTSRTNVPCFVAWVLSMAAVIAAGIGAADAIEGEGRDR